MHALNSILFSEQNGTEKINVLIIRFLYSKIHLDISSVKRSVK